MENVLSGHSALVQVAASCVRLQLLLFDGIGGSGDVSRAFREVVIGVHLGVVMSPEDAVLVL